MAVLDIEGVTVRFGGLVALENVTLAAEAGRITGLIGPNGAGKTTLFNVVTGLQHPSRGQVQVDGRDIGGLPPYRRARLGMARTFQRLELFGALTVRENVQVAASIRAGWSRSSPDTRGDTVAGLLERVGLQDEAGQRADALPTGHGRLLELARALATHPRVLLLDEPASGQSESETLHFAELLRSLARDGMAILLVEHDMQLVMNLCESIYVLDFGRILASGSPNAIRNDPVVLAAYLGQEWKVA